MADDYFDKLRKFGTSPTLKRTVGGVGSEILREGIELYRMFDKPTEAEEKETEEFLKNLYTQVVGSENIEMIQRGDREVVGIAEPENAGAALVRDIGSFGAAFLGVGKITKPLQAIKGIQKFKAFAPKTAKVAGFVGKGEAAAQLSINPYEANLANVIGNTIDDDNEGFLGMVEDYMNPLKSSNDKTELENRIALLGEGLLLTGTLGVAAPVITKGAGTVAKPFINSLRAIQSKGGKAASDFVDTIRTQVSKNMPADDLDRKTVLERKRNSKILDLEALKSPKFSSNSSIRKFSNAVANTFTSRGSMSGKLFERFQGGENRKAAHSKTIENVILNLTDAIDNIVKATGESKEDLLKEINTVLFTKKGIPAISTSKGYVPVKRQKDAYEEALNRLPESARPYVDKARQLQDDFSQTLLGMRSISEVDKQKISESLGYYVRESYKMFENMNYVPSSRVEKEARQYIENEIRRKKPKIKEADLRLEVNSQINNLTKSDYTTVVGSFDQMSRVRAGILKEKQKLPPEIKAFFGEVKDPTQKLLLSTQKIAKFIEDMNFYDDAAKMGKGVYFFDNANTVPGFNVRIPSKAKGAKISPYGALSGKYTSKEMAKFFTQKHEQGLSAVVDQMPSFIQEPWKLLLYLKGQTQKSATVRRHTTHIKNILGGVHMSATNGIKVNPDDIASSWRSLTKGSSDEELQDLMVELSGQGLLNKSAVIGDLKALLRDAESGYFGKKIRTVDKLIDKVPVVGRLKKGAVKADESITDLYIKEDDFFKINMYLQEKEHLTKFNNSLSKNSKRRLTEEELRNEAGRMTRNGLPNYDMIPQYLKELRVVPLVGRFFSFASESTRLAFKIPLQGASEMSLARKLREEGEDIAADIIAQRGRDRLVGYSIYGAGGGGAVASGAVAVGNLGLGMTEKEINDIKAFLPEYMQNDNVVYSLNEEGIPVAYNISPFDAFDFPRKPFQALLHTTLNKDLTEQEKNTFISDTLNEMLTPFFGEALTQEVINAHVFGRGRTSEGRLLRNPLDRLDRFDADDGPLDGNNLKITLYNLFEGTVPGSITDAEAWYSDKLDKEVTEYDQKIYQKDSVIKLLTGVGGMPMNKEYIENLYSFKLSDFGRKKSSRSGMIHDAIRDVTTPEEFINNWLSANEKYYQDYKEIHVSFHIICKR